MLHLLKLNSQQEHFLAMNNHTESTVFYLKVKNLLFKIIFLNKSYLKLDVEGAELQAMPQWLEVSKEKILQGIIDPIYIEFKKYKALTNLSCLH